MRTAALKRTTKETDISMSLTLEGNKQIDVQTGIGFFDHMLTLFAFHANMDLTVHAKGDLEVCDHHTVEDCGILLGELCKKALGDKVGIHRYGTFTIPMDETLAQVSLDISDRPYLVYHCDITRDTIGQFSCEMVSEFLRAFANHAGVTLHVNVFYGENDHHKIEAIFKAFGRAWKEATTIVGNDLPSSKGVL
ncbi:MAG: imidazoleglycerol-phosphate dehydratase HisB [Erysipelotrichaceae bacterium]|nr:imidazoleglycerol-phosphate dehydratase HisB [Erysipelotrichaceae bacterium]